MEDILFTKKFNRFDYYCSMVIVTILAKSDNYWVLFALFPMCFISAYMEKKQEKAYE